MNWTRMLSAAAVVLVSAANVSLAGNSPQEEENKRITHMWVDAAILGQWDKIAQYMSPNFKTHDWHNKTGDLAGLKQGFDGMAKMAQIMKLAMAGDQEYADGDYVIEHYMITATGSGGVRKYPGAEVLKFANGKIIEHWNASQELPMMSANTNGAF